MKTRKILLSIFICLILIYNISADELNLKGEQLEYLIKIFGFKVGKQKITVLGTEIINGIETYHIRSVLQTLKKLEKIYYLRDVEDIYYEKKTMKPVRIVQDIREKAWRDKRTIDIDITNKVCHYVSKNKDVKMKYNHTLVNLGSFIYVLRFIPYKPRQKVKFSILENSKIIDVEMKWLKRSRKRRTRHLEDEERIPVNILKQKGDFEVKLYITKDERKLPIRIETKTLEVKLLGLVFHIKIKSYLKKYRAPKK